MLKDVVLFTVVIGINYICLELIVNHDIFDINVIRIGTIELYWDYNLKLQCIFKGYRIYNNTNRWDTISLKKGNAVKNETSVVTLA